VKSVLTMGQPIDANEPQASSACRDDHSLVVAPNLHGPEAGSLTAFMPSSLACDHLEPDVSELAGDASVPEYHPEATRGGLTESRPFSDR
jgi:hypothetical protein